MEGIDEEIFATVHPHPTLGEWLAEAVLASKNRALNF
jgi:dihydrolipoamide dehydrogenase